MKKAILQKSYQKLKLTISDFKDYISLRFLLDRLFSDKINRIQIFNFLKFKKNKNRKGFYILNNKLVNNIFNFVTHNSKHNSKKKQGFRIKAYWFYNL